MAAPPFAKHPGLLVRQEVPFNAEPPPALLGAAPVTPLEAFYVRNHGPVPALDPAQHRVEVGGRVARPLLLGVDELREAFRPVEVVATLQCAGNRRADLIALAPIPGEIPWDAGALGTASWRGARLADVLAAAGVAPEAAHVELLGVDRAASGDPSPYGSSIPLAKALAPEVLLAYEMNGEPLPPVHGAPVRAVVPGHVGARSVKWLARITLDPLPSRNRFQARAYKLHPPGVDPATAGPEDGLMLGELALNSAFLSPAPGAKVPAGSVEVTGWAIAGGREVVRVDVSPDAGATWRAAELLEDQGPWAWRRWRAELELGPGAHTLAARAWDAAAQTQPEDPRTTWNPKGYVNTAQPRLSIEVG